MVANGGQEKILPNLSRLEVQMEFINLSLVPEDPPTRGTFKVEMLSPVPGIGFSRRGAFDAYDFLDTGEEVLVEQLDLEFPDNAAPAP